MSESSHDPSDEAAGASLLRPPPDERWWDRARDVVGTWLKEPARVATTVVGLAGLGFLGFWLWSAGRPPPTPPEFSLPMATPAAADPASTVSDATAAAVVAHAAGAVVTPGLYTLPGGSRVADLVAAAGGAAPDADIDRVNLAAPVADGQRVYVPRVGEPMPPEAAGEPTGDGASSGPIDINTATPTELDTLPGIGPALAAAIVEHRERNGRFRSVDELLDVPGIGEAKLATLRALVRV